MIHSIKPLHTLLLVYQTLSNATVAAHMAVSGYPRNKVLTISILLLQYSRHCIKEMYEYYNVLFQILPRKIQIQTWTRALN